MTRSASAALALAAFLLASGSVAQTCPPAGMSRGQLLELKSHEFKLPDEARRQALALDLVACLGSTDQELRDGVAFSALSTWMREKQLSARTVGTLMERLVAQLAPDRPDPAGVQRPFAALTLAEVVRFDRIEAFMTDAQLQQLVDASTGYLKSIRDYRGFDEREGWRHGVAHTSDVMLQLAVNPRTTKAQLDQMLAAIATQVAPPGEHFYTYGEGDRLAQAVFYIAKRKLHTADEWKKWFEQVSAPAPLANWQEAWTSQRGIAKHQNTMQFFSMLYLYVRESGPDFQDLVLPSIVAAIKPML
ncbi:MAG TPA: DUF2785 domain-containing protein [Steroidobacteraceae bacterium]|jgi:hypothetical protein|nr:DUF2785 domain-containing protein [Steroidobacteraceae bacterium]